jgi:F-box interacting protein
MGYCSTTKQYKVVRMYDFEHDDGLRDTMCEVYTLDESTHWRPAATRPHAYQPLRVNGRQGAVLCNGNLHFLHKHGLDLLTVFNINAETFSTMVLPPELGSYSSDFMLTELDGCLCVYHTKPMDHPKFTEPYHIWLLRDYEAGKWEKLRCIDWGSMEESESKPLKSSWMAPLDMHYEYEDSARKKKKKKIMFGTAACKVFVVDPDTGVPEVLFSPEKTIIEDCGSWDSLFPAIGLFEERLASAGRSSEEIIFSSPSAQALAEVLTYLPARTVGRLNQVCRGWRAMIKADCFVSAHLHHANHDRLPHIMFTDGLPYGFKALEDVIGTSDTPPVIDEGSRVVCSKPCYGLNAGSFGKYDFVCNPLTKYYRAIPPEDNCENVTCRSTSFLYNVDTKRRHLDNGGADDGFAGRVGLGYAPNIRMHVLVRLVYKEKNRATTTDYKLECKIQLVERHDWVEIDPPPRPVADIAPVYSGGKLYWMVDPEFRPRSSAYCELVMLDLTTLQFHVLQGPPCNRYGGGRVSICELQGELCVTCSRRSTNTIQIWAVDRIGMWSTRHCIELASFFPEYSSEETTPLAINPKDGRILLSTGRSLGYYDDEAVELETVYRLGSSMQGKKFVPVLAMDSLVRPCDAML